jgi:hypothetical protein
LFRFDLQNSNAQCFIRCCRKLKMMDVPKWQELALDQINRSVSIYLPIRCFYYCNSPISIHSGYSFGMVYRVFFFSSKPRTFITRASLPGISANVRLCCICEQRGARLHNMRAYLEEDRGTRFLSVLCNGSLFLSKTWKSLKFRNLKL